MQSRELFACVNNKQVNSMYYTVAPNDDRDAHNYAVHWQVEIKYCPSWEEQGLIHTNSKLQLEPEFWGCSCVQMINGMI